jgi:hypothetical protein
MTEQQKKPTIRIEDETERVLLAKRMRNAIVRDLVPQGRAANDFFEHTMFAGMGHHTALGAIAELAIALIIDAETMLIVDGGPCRDWREMADEVIGKPIDRGTPSKLDWVYSATAPCPHRQTDIRGSVKVG